ncbi:MAG: peptide-methionine (S)-S-oxide reductase MsrA [Gemmataceae bacterium]
MRWKLTLLLGTAVAFGTVAFLLRPKHFGPSDQFPTIDPAEVEDAPSAEPESATFAAGCFWCTEAVFQRLKGVRHVAAGYSGGHFKNPTYEQVCSGATGHAEAVQLTFDPAEVSYAELLEVFWRTHDPTTPNRQGEDYGTQYRSAIFYHSDRQRQLAELYKRKINEAGVFPAPVVTEITPFESFYPAEDDHQNYFRSHGGQLYCRMVIRPKIERLERIFQQKLKDAP